MHHSLRLYSRYREWFLRYYIFQAKWTRLPLIGDVVRGVANAYGQHMSAAYLLTPAEANEIVDSSQGLALGPCTCREVFHHCSQPVNTEIMLSPAGNVFVEERPYDYREITRQEARDILAQCHRNGLIHTIIKCRENLYAICNCCPCCCVPLRLSKRYGIGRALARGDSIVREFRRQVTATSGL